VLNDVAAVIGSRYFKDPRNVCFAARECDDENVEFGRVLKDPSTSRCCRGTHFRTPEIYSIHLLYMALDHLDVKTSQRGVSSFSSTVRSPLYSRPATTPFDFSIIPP